MGWYRLGFQGDGGLLICWRYFFEILITDHFVFSFIIHRFLNGGILLLQRVFIMGTRVIVGLGWYFQLIVWSIEEYQSYGEKISFFLVWAFLGSWHWLLEPYVKWDGKMLVRIFQWILLHHGLFAHELRDHEKHILPELFQSGLVHLEDHFELLTQQFMLAKLACFSFIQLSQKFIRFLQVEWAIS